MKRLATALVGALVLAACGERGGMPGLELLLSFAADALPAPQEALSWRIIASWPGGEAREEGAYVPGGALGLRRIREGEGRRVRVELFAGARIYYHGKSDVFRLDADTPPIPVLLGSAPSFGPGGLSLDGPRELGAAASLSRSPELTLELDVARGAYVRVSHDATVLPRGGEERVIERLVTRDGLRLWTGWRLEPPSCVESGACPREVSFYAVLADEQDEYFSEVAQARLSFDERGFTCTGAGEGGCERSCGDGRVDASEACDDGDGSDDDGCSSTCQVEAGYRCSGAPSRCGRIIHVSTTGSPSGDGQRWASAMRFLQDALALANAGDEIWVARGLYRPDEGAGVAPGDDLASFVLGEGVALYGGFVGDEASREGRDTRANETVLDGELGGSQFSAHVVRCGATSGATVLDGFTIRGGRGPLDVSDAAGAGMEILGGAPVVRDCRFEDNGASHGGALYLHGASPALSDCTFARNSALESGGAIYSDGSTFTAYRLTFEDNTVTTQDPDHEHVGGGALAIFEGDVTLIDARFVGNESRGRGGAVLTRRSLSFPAKVTLVNALLNGNRAWLGGGAAYVHSGELVLAGATLAHNCGAFYRNVTTPQVLELCEASASYAGALGINAAEAASAVVRSSILWGNTPVASELAAASVEYSCVEGGAAGTGNIAADPEWLDADGADDVPGTADDVFLLGPSSPAIDAGDNTAFPVAVTTDLAGGPRRLDAPSVADTGRGAAPVCDMGAFERP